MDWVFLYLYGDQDGDRWSSSGTRNHAAVSGCQYGKSGNPSGGCFDLCTKVWNRICLACRTGRLACQLSDLLCGAQKIMAENPALNKHSACSLLCIRRKMAFLVPTLLGYIDKTKMQIPATHLEAVKLPAEE